ncbi:hypothetical protein H920_15066 [Fukomys damarensis]|uniref:Uncharacterized protein n=1 Tax=Fukomys damarensis TaxID=885580 RepID=A0A091CV68_FUKDA|nr:hypothetical protein H920_15066 [Fukomys damarensis]
MEGAGNWGAEGTELKGPVEHSLATCPKVSRHSLPSALEVSHIAKAALSSKPLLEKLSHRVVMQSSHGAQSKLSETEWLSIEIWTPKETSPESPQLSPLLGVLVLKVDS